VSVSTHRIGLVVPSSNVTVETELPALLNRHAHARFSFHSSRMRLHRVSADQLRAMNAQRERCVLEVGDAGVDAVLYACLVALMAGGPGEHQRLESAPGGCCGLAYLSRAGLLRSITWRYQRD
jgi:maleate isomerase